MAMFGIRGWNASESFRHLRAGGVLVAPLAPRYKKIQGKQWLSKPALYGHKCSALKFAPMLYERFLRI